MALIIVSDGKHMSAATVASARGIKQKYGDMLCIYTVLVGNDAGGTRIMEEIAKAGGCGFSTSADQIYSGRDMADFVEKVFFAKTAKTAAPMDSDGDGVYDSRDECPGTPKGAKVDSKGCWILNLVHFDTAKWDIKPGYDSILREVVAVMKQNPDLKVEVRGHADNRGSKEYNQTLSEKRARAVGAYLIQEGIDPGRLVYIGYSFTEPIAANDTPQGMARNRRVELAPIR